MHIFIKKLLANEYLSSFYFNVFLNTKVNLPNTTNIMFLAFALFLYIKKYV